MNELLIELLAVENERLRGEIVKLKARLYDLEHPAIQDGIDWSVFDVIAKGCEENHGNDGLVDGFGAERSHYSL